SQRKYPGSIERGRRNRFYFAVLTLNPTCRKIYTSKSYPANSGRIYCLAESFLKLGFEIDLSERIYEELPETIIMET
ncbi:MAG: hypothetical protein M3Z56_05845, partial [Bacteroidota bacterium]|nr:hypothetical protein [Bacteroidota bacterium]